MKLTGENRSTREKSCPSATLSTINPTWNDPGSNPFLRGERPVTNRLSHGTAVCKTYYLLYRRNLGGGANASEIFFLPRDSFYWLLR
jgi:hypothetical protein